MAEETIIEFEANEERRGRTLRFREWLEYANCALLKACGIDYDDGGADEDRMRRFYAEYVSSDETVAESIESLADWWIEKYDLDRAPDGLYEAQADARLKKFLLDPYHDDFEFEEFEVLAEGGCGEFTFSIETGEVLRVYPDNGQGGEHGSWADAARVDVERSLKEIGIDPEAEIKDGETFATLNLTIITDAGETLLGTQMMENGDVFEGGVLIQTKDGPVQPAVGDDFDADPAAYDAKNAVLKPNGDPLHD